MNIKDTEPQIKSGARPISKLHRTLHKLVKRERIKGLPVFDWQVGYDVRDAVGPIAIKNQGDNFSCSGQAASYFLEIAEKLHKTSKGAISAKSIYGPIAYPGGGTTVARLVTQITAKGANLEHDVPSYYVTGEPLSEAMMIENSWQTKDMIQKAFAHAGYTLYDCSEDIDEVASVIKSWGAVICEIRAKNGETPGWGSATPTPPSPGNQNPYWFHFMTAIGAKLIDGKKYIVFLQSEGPDWGDKGVQYLSEDYFTSGNIIDAFTFIHDSNITPNASNHSLAADLLRFFRNLWGLVS